MTQKAISLTFILPCYNVENYIGQCLDSLYNQDIDESNYEVICVNDCSTDNTKRIIEKYADMHSNITLVNHTTNKTAGGARNTGLDIAKGKYCWFVDPDDYVKPNVLANLIAICEDNELDELLFNYDVLYKDSNTILTKEIFINSQVDTGINFIEKFFQNKLSNLSIVWQQLFRVDFIRQHFIRFPEIRVSQDASFSWRALLYSTKMMSIQDSPYIYRQNSNSVTAKQQVSISGEVLFSKTILFSYELQKMLNEFKAIPDINREIENTAIWAVNNIWSELQNAKKTEVEVFRKKCIKHKEEIKAVSAFQNQRIRRILNTSNYGEFIFQLSITFEKLIFKIKHGNVSRKHKQSVR